MENTITTPSGLEGFTNIKTTKAATITESVMIRPLFFSVMKRYQRTSAEK